MYRASALGEIGRIERTLFMLDWTESPQLRMECQAGLNKGEARHALARAVFAHSQGRVHDRSHDAQQKRVMALNLVIANLGRCWYSGNTPHTVAVVEAQGVEPIRACFGN